MNKKLFLIASSMTLLSVAQAVDVLVNETFPDGTRTDQNPPSSLAWYSSAASSNLYVQDNALVNNTTGTTRGGQAYFTTINNPYELAVGQTMLLSFGLTPLEIGTGGYAGGFGIGLFNSLGTNRVTGDGQNPTTNTSTGYAGYITFSSSGDGTQYLHIDKRDKATGALITNSNGYTLMDKTSNTQDFLQQDQTYDIAFSVTRDSVTQVTISMTVSGGHLENPLTIETVDNSGYFSFDTIGFSSSQNGSNGTGMGLSAMSDIELKVIPEASTSLFLLLAACVLTGFGRKLRGRQ